MKIYLAKQGDTLEIVAQTQNLNVDKLKEMNPNLTQSEPLAAGTKIILSKSANGEMIHAQEEYQTYVVKQGDTLWKLSKKWGIDLQSLLSINPQLKNPNVLMTNEIIYVPKTISIQDNQTPESGHCSAPQASESSYNGEAKTPQNELFNQFPSSNESGCAPQYSPNPDWPMQQEIASPYLDNHMSSSNYSSYVHLNSDQPPYQGPSHFPIHTHWSSPASYQDTTVPSYPSYSQYPASGYGYPMSHPQGYAASCNPHPPMLNSYHTPDFTQSQVPAWYNVPIHLHEKYNPYAYDLHLPYAEFGETQAMTSMQDETKKNAQYTSNGQSENNPASTEDHPTMPYPATYEPPSLPQAPPATQQAEENLTPCKEKALTELTDESKEKPDIKLRNRHQKPKNTRKQIYSSKTRMPTQAVAQARTH